MHGDPLNPTEGFEDLLEPKTKEQDMTDKNADLSGFGGLVEHDEDGPMLRVVSEEQSKTRRALGVVVVMALTAIAAGVLGLLAFTVFRGDEAMLEMIASTVQPGTIIVAAISAIAGIAAGVGLKNE